MNDKELVFATLVTSRRMRGESKRNREKRTAKKMVGLIEL